MIGAKFSEETLGGLEDLQGLSIKTLERLSDLQAFRLDNPLFLT